MALLGVNKLIQNLEEKLVRGQKKSFVVRPNDNRMLPCGLWSQTGPQYERNSMLQLPSQHLRTQQAGTWIYQQTSI